MMKKAIAWVGSWVCFWLGHFWSKPLEWSWPKMLNAEDEEYKWVSWYVGFWYVPYNQLMFWSVQIQDWAELDERGPWRKPEPVDEEAERGLED